MTETDTRPDPWRILQWPLLIASAGVAAWVSYTQQRQLGIYVGWDSPWGLPVILDGLAAATLLSYIRKPAPFNRAVSTLVVATAVVGNAQAAIYDPATADLPAPLWAVIAWKVLPPLAVFTIAHYIAHERQETGIWVPKSRPEAVEPAVVAAEKSVSAPGGDGSHTASRSATQRNGTRTAPAASGSASKAASRSKHSDEQLASRVVSEQWSTLSGDQLAEKLHVAKGRALRVRNLARSSSQPAPNGQPSSPHPAAATNGGVHAGA